MNHHDLAGLVHTLAWTLLHFIWQGCALAIAFALVMLAMRRTAPATRYLAGCITLLMMAMAPAATFAWLWNHAEQALARSNMPDKLAGLATPVHAPKPAFLALVICWMLGAGACLAWMLIGWFQAQRLARLEAFTLSRGQQSTIMRLSRCVSVSACVRVVDHARVVAPIAFGTFKPIILIPASMLTSLSPAHLEAIIAHELAHVRRLDYLVNLLQTLVESLLFYHPAVWWVSRQVRQEREFCCDDIAAAVCGNRITYARALTELETLRSASLRLGLSSQGGSLMKRIVRLVGEGKPGAEFIGKRRSQVAASAAGVALLAVASAAFALAQPASTSPPPCNETNEVVTRTIEEQGSTDLFSFAGDVLIREAPEIMDLSIAEPAFDYQIEIAPEQLIEASRTYGQVHFEPLQLQRMESTIELPMPVLIQLRIAAMIDPDKMPSDVGSPGTELEFAL